MSSKLKKLVRIADEKAHSLVSPIRRNTDKNLMTSYQRSVFEWKHTYVAWIRENETKAASENLADFLVNNREWVVYCTKTGYFAEAIVTYLSEALSDNSKEVGVIYGDEDYICEVGSVGMRMCPFFKPDYSQETLLSFSYFGEFIFLKRSIAEKISGANVRVKEINYTDALALYDIALKATEIAGSNGVAHINRVIYHRSVMSLDIIDSIYNAISDGIAISGGICAETGMVEDTPAYYAAYTRVEAIVSSFLEDDANIARVLVGCGADGLDIRKAALERRGLSAEFIKDTDRDLYRICYKPHNARVSVVILSKDNPELLESCVAHIRNITEYGNYEIVVVDNGSNEVNKAKCVELSDKYTFSYYHHPMEFNFSALCNFGVTRSTGELILLMNDDVQVVDAQFMKLMAGYASRKDIGAVGARLRYGDGISIQHVGVTSLGIGPSHQLQKKSDDRNRYYGRNRVDYEMLGVTAACLMVKRSDYEKVGGLDESLKVAYNDVDFCFKLVEAGLKNVQCNGALLLHHESLTRGFDGDSDAKWNRLLTEKEGLYSRHPKFKAYDPYHSASLIDNSSEYICSQKTSAQDFGWRSKFAPASKGDDKKTHNAGNLKKTFGFRYTIDHSTLQRRFNPEDEDFFWIDGWVYVPGADHVLIGKSILLKGEDGQILETECRDVYRPDVEEMLPAAQNIAMCGFLTRLSPLELPKGRYTVGIKLSGSGKESCIWSDKIIENR